MLVNELFDSKILAEVYTEVASNKIAPLGAGLFPATKQMSLDIKQILTNKGLPVALKPSAYDTVSTIRSREGIKVSETELAFFKESMLLKEQDEIDIMRLQSASDPYAQDVVNRVYDDTNNLIEGAEVISEIMRMQLLSNANGNPSIYLSADGATYEYNYDPDNEYKTNNYIKLSGTSKWDDTANSDPMADVEAGQDAVEERTGTRPSILLLDKRTFNLLKQNDKIKSHILAQNATANVLITGDKVKEIFSTELGVTILVYSKKYKDFAGATQDFYPYGMATLLPEGTLGRTVFGSTPEERTRYQIKDADVSIVGTGIALTVSTGSDPVQTKITASEAVLPSFPRMMETYTINACGI